MKIMPDTDKSPFFMGTVYYFRGMEIRRADINDIDEIGKLYRDTVLSVNKRDYSEEQVRVWASTFDNEEGWVRRIKEQYFFVALINKQIVGFASIDHNGYLDLLYVHRDFQRQGIATQLYNEIELTAREQEFEEINAQSSITARPFFEKQGFKIRGEKHKTVNGVSFTNAVVIKKVKQLAVKT